MKKSTVMLLLTIIAVAGMVSAMVLSSSAQIFGDLDRNDTLTSADIRIMLRYMVGGRTLTAEEFSLADYDGNKRVDTLDARYVLQVLALDYAPSTMATTTTTTTTTTMTTTTTTRPSLDDDGYYDDVVRP